MFCLAGIAEPLIYCLIGPKWDEAATYLPLICVNMSLYPLHAINLNMLQIQGRSDIFLYLDIIKKTIGLIPLAIGIFFNIYWMLIVNVIIGGICFFLNSYYTGKNLGYTSWEQLKDISVSYYIATFVAFIIYFLKYMPLSSWVVLPLQIIVGCVLIIVICEIIHPQEYLEIKNILKNIRKNTHIKNIS